MGWSGPVRRRSPRWPAIPSSTSCRPKSSTARWRCMGRPSCGHTACSNGRHCGASSISRIPPIANRPPMVQRPPPNFIVPRQACDCHTHVFGPHARYELTPQRSYTPREASIDELVALQRALHLDRVVIVQPSVYGTDNSCTVDALRDLDGRGRAVAVIDDAISATELDALHRAGVRGVRVNLATAGVHDPEIARRRLAAAASRVAPLNWHVQVYADIAMIAALRAAMEDLPVALVIDHFGGAQAVAGPAQSGFAALLALGGPRKGYVKLSA